MNEESGEPDMSPNRKKTLSQNTANSYLMEAGGVWKYLQSVQAFRVQALCDATERKR